MIVNYLDNYFFKVWVNGIYIFIYSYENNENKQLVIINLIIIIKSNLVKSHHRGILNLKCKNIFFN